MKTFLSKNNIDYFTNIPLFKITGMNQQNLLPIVAYPDSIEKLKMLVIYLNLNREFTYDIYGGLTNTYLCTSYSRDVVIVTTKVVDIQSEIDFVRVGCGFNLTKISRFFCNEGISGYTGFVGIPGTVAGAAINNAGSNNSSMDIVVKGVSLLKNNGDLIYLTNLDLQYNTRTSILKEEKINGVILSVDFDIRVKDKPEYLNEKLKYYQALRKKNIDGNRKSLGSVFVSTTLIEIYKRHRVKIFIKKLFKIPNKYIFHNKDVNTYLDFLFLGKPKIAKHCDSFNRFCWDDNTTELDFFDYIGAMQKLANNKLKLEVKIKK